MLIFRGIQRMVERDELKLFFCLEIVCKPSALHREIGPCPVVAVEHRYVGVCAVERVILRNAVYQVVVCMVGIMVAKRRVDGSICHHHAACGKIAVIVSCIGCVVYEIAGIQYKRDAGLPCDPVSDEFVSLKLTEGGELVLRVTVYYKSERPALRECGEVEVAGCQPVVRNPIVIEGTG